MPDKVINNQPDRMSEAERNTFAKLAALKKEIDNGLDRLDYAEGAVRVKENLTAGATIPPETLAKYGIDTERARLTALKNQQVADQTNALAALKTKYVLGREDTIDFETGLFSRA